MEALNLPTYSFKIKSENGNELIFDRFRKKYVKLTPEEWVRQNFALYLINEKSYPESRFIIEKSLRVNGLSRRCDILFLNETGIPWLMVECKAPSCRIGQLTFEQVSVYNIKFRVPFLVITNGLQHYCCKVDFVTGNIEFLKEVPAYGKITGESAVRSTQ